MTADDWAIWPIHDQSPYTNNLARRLEPPSAEHPFGTDQNGRDVLARIIHGGRVSLAVGFVSMGIALVIGILIGALAGWFGGKTDMAISRFIEIVICFPTFFLILTVMAFWPPSIWNIMIVIGITGWTGIARLVRGEVLRIRNEEFVLAAQVTGARQMTVLFRHVLPHALAPVIVSAAFSVAGAMLTESSLSFLGFGVQPPTSSWGQILGQSKPYVRTAWWLVVFPGVVLFLSITAYNILGDRLRERSDPRSVRRSRSR
ncbi:MAG: ABC transporter permease [Deltaproteobacteria bacterium]|nr:ABC transporter permease [Deltaproteobacteria bacterium]